MKPQHAVTVFTFLLTLTVAGLVFQSATLDAALEYNSDASEWCEERNGDLSNSQVIGPHGGLHCELPNGTSVHMDEVITMQETDQ